MKKSLVFLLVVFLTVGSVFASDYRGASKKDSFALGLNVGTNNGVIMNYGMGKFDLEGIIGFGVFNGNSLDIEVAANYAVYDIAKGNFDGYMPITVGGEVGLAMSFKDNFKMGINLLVPVKLAYTFEKAPFTVYFRVAPGIRMNVVKADSDNFLLFGMEASIGGTYNF